MNSDIDNLIAATGKRLGFTGVEPDADGTCTLDFGDTVVMISAGDDGSLIRLMAPVAEVPSPCPSAVLERLLDAQFFFKETRGYAFSYQKETGAVLLHGNIFSSILDPATFETAIENMLCVSRQFSDEIAAMLETEEDDGRMAGESTGMTTDSLLC